MPQHLNKLDAASSCAEGKGKRTGDELNDQHCANQQAPAGTSLQGKCLSIPLHPLFRPTKRNRRNRPGRFCEASSPDPKVQNPTTLAEAQHGTQVIYGVPIYLEKKIPGSQESGTHHKGKRFKSNVYRLRRIALRGHDS